MASSVCLVIMPREALPSGSAPGPSIPSPGTAKAAPAAPSTPRPPRDRNWRRVHIDARPCLGPLAALQQMPSRKRRREGLLFPTTLLCNDAIVLLGQIVVL